MSARTLLTVIDERIRLALRGTEIVRGVVDSVSGRTATVLTGGSLLPAIIPAHAVPVVAGSVVECWRPRGGALHVIEVIGVSGPDYIAATIDANRGTVSVVTVLPTASVDYRGKTYLLELAGSVDAFWRCRRKADGTYEWVDIS